MQIHDESIWLSQQKIAELFGVQKAAISKHLKNIYTSGELTEEATVSKMETVRIEGGRSVSRYLVSYNLDVIIAVGYRVNSRRATQFRIWATGVIKKHLLHGVSVNQRMIAMEDRIDRRLSKHDADIIELRQDVDFFISSSLPPKEKVFVEGKMLDAQVELTRIVKTAKRRLARSFKHRDTEAQRFVPLW